jgi:hypothetical protein
MMPVVLRNLGKIVHFFGPFVEVLIWDLFCSKLLFAEVMLEISRNQTN